jgi:hypothetical protein
MARVCKIVGALVAVIGAAAGSGCGNSMCQDFGQVQLAATVPAGRTIDSATYRLVGTGVAPLTGSLSRPSMGAAFARLISHVPAGVDYAVTIAAKSKDGHTICTGMDHVEVSTNKTATLTIALTCQLTGTTGNGMVQITVGIQCPGLTVTPTGSPLTVSVGGVVHVSAMAEDATDGGPLTYHWAALKGMFADPNSPMTTYTCTQAGAVSLVVTVSNGDCQDVGEMPVTCGSPCEVDASACDAGAD